MSYALYVHSPSAISRSLWSQRSYPVSQILILPRAVVFASLTVTTNAVRMSSRWLSMATAYKIWHIYAGSSRGIWFLCYLRTPSELQMIYETGASYHKTVYCPIYYLGRINKTAISTSSNRTSRGNTRTSRTNKCPRCQNSHWKFLYVWVVVVVIWIYSQ